MVLEDIVFVGMFQYFQPEKFYSRFLRCSVRKVAIVGRKNLHDKTLGETKKNPPEFKKKKQSFWHFFSFCVIFNIHFFWMCHGQLFLHIE
jgi:hypothetical protein